MLLIKVFITLQNKFDTHMQSYFLTSRLRFETMDNKRPLSFI